MIMNLHHDEPKVVSTTSFNKSRETTQPATGRLSEEEMQTLGLAIASRATNRDDSKLPFAIGMSHGNSLSTILSSILEQSSSRQSFQRPIQGEHDVLSLPSTLQQQISALNNAELLQLLIHQNTFGSSLFNRDGSIDVLPVGLGVHNLSNSASSIPSFGMLQSSSTVGQAPQECGNTGLRVLCPARGMPADHDFERAHFTITPDMKHGEELRCSHPVCQAGGVKFCYCAICKKPAAKRNFRGRHHHIEEDPRIDTRNDFSDSLQRDDATLPIVSAPQESLVNSINNMCGVASQKSMKQSNGAQEQTPWCKMVDGTRSHRSPITTKSDTRDSIVVSCKARGMPSDHNSKTAYFVISPSTQHGDDLVCSYESCNDAGSKFSFCAYCSVPVARRGFRAHCLQSGHDGGSSEKGLPTGTRQLSSENIISDASRDGNPKISSKDRMEQWDMLLEKRPSNGDSEGLASWIKQVFDVSSIDTVMEEDHGVTSPSGITRSEEEVITTLIDSVVSTLGTSNCYSNDMTTKQPKKRKISF